MSLVGLAIIGKRNEPLYMCDCESIVEPIKDPDYDSTEDPEEGGVEHTEHTEASEVDCGHDSRISCDASSGKNDEDETTDHSEIEDQVNKFIYSADEGDDENQDPFGFFEVAKINGVADSLSSEFRFLIHSSLDQLSEAVETSGAGLPVPRGRTGSWLGRLTTFEEKWAVHGRISATSIKFMAVTKIAAREADVRAFLDDIHAKYVALVMNPFTELKGPIRSNSFDLRVKEALRNYDLKRTYEF